MRQAWIGIGIVLALGVATACGRASEPPASSGAAVQAEDSEREEAAADDPAAPAEEDREDLQAEGASGSTPVMQPAAPAIRGPNADDLLEGGEDGETQAFDIEE